MLLTWSWKLRPTRARHRLLEHALESQRLLYNAALEERIGAWAKARLSVTRFDQTKSLTQIRRDDPLGYGAQPVAMGRWTLAALDRAMQGFFARVKKGGTAGFPRFRSRALAHVRYGRMGRDQPQGRSARHKRASTARSASTFTGQCPLMRCRRRRR